MAMARWGCGRAVDRRASCALRDHTGKKRKYWLVLKKAMRNARSAPFFFGCATLAWHLQTAFPLEKFRAAKFVVLLSTCERESGSGSG
jgi:hypothetical protein